MASISGQNTSNIDNVDGFYTTQGGGVASTAPTLSAVVATPFANTLTISNFASYAGMNPNWQISIEAGGSEIIANASVTRSISNNLLSDTLVWSDGSAVSGTRTVKVRAQRFGDYIQSAEVTTTYTKAVADYNFFRLRGVTSAGVDTSDRLALGEVRFWTGAGQTGTRIALGNMASDSTPLAENLVLSQGRVYSASYQSWKAMDGSGGTMAWLLGATAAQNWWQAEFKGTVPTIASLEILQRANADTSYIKLQGSYTGAFTGEETDFGVYYVPNNQTVTYIG